ncbi:DUF6207 family protein [Streptomyces sp. NPDC000229]|uniref:DUF6207 family protein n=1 Tax=Streptomyces sp. NPDC000229 TaxID=3154247 RepID=UPI00331C412A
MDIDEQHVAEPGLAVLDITAADEETVRAVMEGLQQLWPTSGVTAVWRGARRGRGQGPGVRRRTPHPHL